MPIQTSWQDISEAVADHRRRTRWSNHVLKNRAVLDEISDIVRLGALWDWSYGKLYLDYAGKARKEEEAREDLARIMSALKVIFGDLKATSGGDRYPTGEYRAEGKLGNAKTTFILSVRWLPADCHVSTQRTRYWGENVRHSIYCMR